MAEEKLAGRITRLKINDGSEKVYTIETPLPDIGSGGYTVVKTLDKSNWVWMTNAGAYANIVQDIEGLKLSDIPSINVNVDPRTSVEDVSKTLEEWSNIYSAEVMAVQEGVPAIAVYSRSIPSINFSIMIKW